MEEIMSTVIIAFMTDYNTTMAKSKGAQTHITVVQAQLGSRCYSQAVLERSDEQP